MGLFSIFKRSVLYYPGCYSKSRLDGEIELYKKILKRIGIKFAFFDVECCGGLIREAGYEAKVRKLARKNFKKLQDEGISKIITSCGLCYKTFLSYEKMLPDWNIETEHILISILERLEDEPELIEYEVNEVVTYHDSCYLKHEKLFGAPRKILEMLGYRVLEMKDNRADALCSGSCGNLSEENPELAKSIALKRIKQAKDLGVKKIVVADSIAYGHLKKVAGDIEIVGLFNILGKGLGIDYVVGDKEVGDKEVEEDE